MKRNNVPTSTQDLTSGREYIGTVTKISYHEEGETVEKKDGGEFVLERPQIEVCVKPEDIKIGGETGEFHLFMTVTKQENSKIGLFLRALEEIGFDMKGDWETLIGQTFQFEEHRDIKIGTMTGSVTIPMGKVSKPKSPSGTRIGGIQIGKKKATEKTVDSIIGPLLKKDGISAADLESFAKKENLEVDAINEYLTEIEDKLDAVALEGGIIKLA